jgi:hypothetical protein
VTATRGSLATWPAGVLQRDLWERLARAGDLGRPASQTRALRLRGDVVTDRLLGAIVEVTGALDILGVTVRSHAGAPVMVPGSCRPRVRVRDAAGPTAHARALEAGEMLRAERDRAIPPAEGPLVRFDVVRAGERDVVLAVTGHALVCDLHSLYAVLGAVVQAYAGRLRASEYPPFGRRERELGHLEPATLRLRRGWWADRLGAAGGAGLRACGPATGAPVRASARIDARSWTELATLTRPVGGNGWLAVLALAAHWWCERRGHVPPVGAMLDLRQVAGSGAVVGPLSDRIVFFPELEAGRPRSFRELLLRTHAALLDAVVHHLPYGMLGPLGGQLFVHYCPVPRSSATTRAEASPAVPGLSIELFADRELAGRGSGHGGWEGIAWDLALAEEGADLVLMLDHDPTRDRSLAELPGWVAAAARAVATDPEGTVPGP